MTSLSDLRDLAVHAARVGGSAALRYFRDPTLNTEWKGDDSPVTRADREAEVAIKTLLQNTRPDDAWLGEETGADEGGTSGYRWIVDPIDGTRNFVRGIPLWATLVACEQETQEGPQVVASAVAIPGLDTMYDAFKGGGARENGVPIQVSEITDPAQALWCYETREWFLDNGLGKLFDELGQATHLQRGLCDAYGHMLVASGRAEVIVEPKLSTWDVAATSLVVSEAGGSFSDLEGAMSIRSNNAVVTNGHLHQWTLDSIKRLHDV